MKDRPRVARDCWCGNARLEPFSPEYKLCQACGTLVSQQGLTDEQLAVRDDAHDYYGKEYWLSHQRDGLGLPTIEGRARADLPVRCTYWLRTLLRYKLPPGRVLELGAAHGGAVALLRWAGFDAVGAEMSPWVADFARRRFDVPMLVGPVEGQDLEPASLDAVVLYDVLEHLPDPEKTMGCCARLLKPEGLLVVQTPQYPDGHDFERLTADDNPFLEMMASDMAGEHLYLFSRRSVGALLGRLGFGWARFEPPAHVYDMYLLAGRQEAVARTDAEIGAALECTPAGRMVRALIDAQVEQQRQARQAHASLAGTLQGVAALERELAERREEIAAAAAEIARLRERLAGHGGLGPQALRWAREVRKVMNRFPRVAGAMRGLLKRAG